MGIKCKIQSSHEIKSIRTRVTQTACGTADWTAVHCQRSLLKVRADCGHVTRVPEKMNDEISRLPVILFK